MGSPAIFNGSRTKLLTANGLLLQSGQTIDYNGPKNYIGNSTFGNNSTAGWSLSHSTLDSTTKLPNQASGSWTAAAGTLSFSVVSGGAQLSGAYSGSLASSAATTAGDMLVSDAITLDLEALASVQTFSFFYNVASGAANVNMSGTSSNSFGVAIYDVTNAAWIQPAGVFNLVQNSGTAKCAGTFQVASNCTSVRLALYFPNASTGAVTLTVDDFVLGPQVVQYGAPVTDWQSYTPTFTGFGTATNVEFYWRRVGANLEVKGKFTTGTTTATEGRISLPTGFVSTTLTQGIVVAGVMVSGYSAATRFGLYTLIESAQSYMTFGAQDSASSGITKANGTQITSSTVVTLTFSCPIQGWSSSVQMSNDTATQVIAMRAEGNPASATANNPIIVPTVGSDTNGAYNNTTGKYTIPASGFYVVQGFLSSASTGVTLFLYVDSVNVISIGQTDSNGEATFTGMYYCNAGQQIWIGTGTTFDASDADLSIFRLSGPATIAATDTVAAVYNTATAQVLASGAVINYDTKEIDTTGSVTTGAGAWRFTCPISGKYLVSAFYYNNAASQNYIIVRKNTINQSETLCAASSTAINQIILNCVAGDYIDCTTGGLTLTATAIYNKISITRIGN